MVKAQDCESWDCEFKSRLSPHLAVQESYGAESLYLFEAPAFFARGVTVVGSLLWAYVNREENVNELPNHRRLAMLQVLPVRAL